MRMPSLKALAEDSHADVCVVGAGIAGLTTAYLLTRAGQSVIVLDDGDIGGGATANTTAHLSNALDDRYMEIERLHGGEGSRLAAQSHTAAIKEIEATVFRERIDCDFERVDGYLFLSPDARESLLDEELLAARRAGLADVAKVGRAPLLSFNTGPSLRFPAQAQFHPLKYLSGLVRAIQRDGGRIFTGTHVDRIDGGTPALVKAGERVVKAAAVVVATNTPVNDLVAIHTKQAPYMSYVIAVRVPRGSVTKALYWDTEDPYHYLRLQRMEDPAGPYDLLIVGGEDHKTGQVDETEERLDRLHRWARDRFPMMQEVEFRWSGQVMETIDGLAFIGRNPMDKNNVFIATGDCGMGMTHGTIAGLLLTDLILGRENPWATLYDPGRKSIRAAGAFVKETSNVAFQYTDWLTPGDVSSVAAIAPGRGAVLRRGLEKVAIYRDDAGGLHERSAACPHLGCVVGWNPTEKTWDCPCHGSRFDAFGKVLSGPANQDLAPSTQASVAATGRHRGPDMKRR